MSYITQALHEDGTGTSRWKQLSSDPSSSRLSQSQPPERDIQTAYLQLAVFRQAEDMGRAGTLALVRLV